MTIVRLWAYAHSPPRGIWGHAPPENFGNFNTLRAFLMHSGSSFWTDLVAISIRALFCKHPELFCCNFIVCACDKMGGGGGGGELSPPCFQSGGAEAPPAPPISPPLFSHSSINCLPSPPCRVASAAMIFS